MKHKQHFLGKFCQLLLVFAKFAQKIALDTASSGVYYEKRTKHKRGGAAMIELDNGVFMEHVEDLVERKRWPELREIMRLLEPADIALILAELPLDRLPLLYRLLPKELAAEVFVEMEPDAQGILISSFSDAAAETQGLPCWSSGWESTCQCRGH